MLQSGLFTPASMRAVTHVVVLISAGVISCCTSRWVGGWVGFTTFLQQRSAYAALTTLPVADPQSLDEPSRGEAPRLLSPSAAAARIARFRGGGGGTFGMAVARLASATVCHARSSATRPEQLVLHETEAPGLDSHLPEAPSQLPSFTLSGILPATQEGPQYAPPPTNTPRARPISPEETLITIYQRNGGEVRW